MEYVAAMKIGRKYEGHPYKPVYGEPVSPCSFDHRIRTIDDEPLRPSGSAAVGSNPGARLADGQSEDQTSGSPAQEGEATGYGKPLSFASTKAKTAWISVQAVSMLTLASEPRGHGVEMRIALIFGQPLLGVRSICSTPSATGTFGTAMSKALFKPTVLTMSNPERTIRPSTLISNTRLPRYE